MSSDGTVLDYVPMSRWEPDAAGRLIKAAITLFDEQGYHETTVAEIADAAGLTKRTFFRYFADKREVLFNGSSELTGAGSPASPRQPRTPARWPRCRPAWTRVADAVRRPAPVRRQRSRIVAANPELQERELIKLQSSRRRSVSA